MTNPDIEQAIRDLARAEQREDIASKLYALAVDTFEAARQELAGARRALTTLIDAAVEEHKSPRRHAARTENPGAADGYGLHRPLDPADFIDPKA